jgi:hypothetical protein
MVFAFNRKRRRRRNAWKGAPRRHRRAARLGWRRGHRGIRRRRRCRNPEGVSFNRRRRRRRHNNPRRGRRHNPMTGVMAGFDVGTLTKGGMVVGGMILTNVVTKQITNFVPISFLKTSPGNLVTELITAGLLGYGMRRVAPQFAGPVFFGGVLDVIKRAADKYVAPLIGGTLAGLGLGDYLSIGDARGAKPLNWLGEDNDLEGLDDYLSVQNSRNLTPLTGFGIQDGEMAVGNELAVS